MPLGKQVCSLDLAKRLKELGVKQDALYWWSTHTIPSTLWNRADLDNSLEEYEGPAFSTYAAFTVAELGEFVKDIPRSVAGKIPDKFMLNDSNSELMFSADFWAKMLIYLVENKVVRL